jgi:hypothetical protein
MQLISSMPQNGKVNNSTTISNQRPLVIQNQNISGAQERQSLNQTVNYKQMSEANSKSVKSTKGR